MRMRRETGFPVRLSVTYVRVVLDGLLPRKTIRAPVGTTVQFMRIGAAAAARCFYSAATRGNSFSYDGEEGEVYYFASFCVCYFEVITAVTVIFNFALGGLFCLYFVCKA